MEKVIDRKEYRRSVEGSQIIEEEQIDILQKKIRKILLQSMGVAFILLVISFLKYFHCDELLKRIDELLTMQISFSSIQKGGQTLFDEAVKHYTKLDYWVNQMFFLERKENQENSGDSSLLNSNIVLRNEEKKETEKIDDINNDNLNSEMNNNKKNVENNLNSGDNKVTNYKVAVEGMNQMLEDAKHIKENYEMTVPVIGTITSEFGVRNSTNPIVSKYHSGLDIAANTGTQILAALDGKIIEVGNDTYLGKYFKIQKEDIIMVYAHCSKIFVKKGDNVKKGSLIAYVGNTGNSTGPHLHFEVTYQNRLINPKDILDI